MICTEKKVSAVLLPVFLLSGFLHAQALFQDSSRPVNERVNDLLGRMTLEEKAALTAGTIRGPDGIRQGADATRAIEIKNGPDGKPFTLPKLLIAHGPYGFRGAYSGENGDITIQYGTAFPASVNLACMWNPELLEEICTAMGLEMRSYGFHVSAGPAFNIIRDPHNGRAVEYFTEDPYLNSVLVAHYIPALQKTGMVAVPKHFAANNTERCRGFINVKVGKRALHEIYFPAFKAAVDADAGMLMNAYNKINGVHCSQSEYLLNDILREKWGFQGMVVSDWCSIHSTDAAEAGVDLEMPEELYFGQKLIERNVSEERIHEMARRILKTMFTAGLFDEVDLPSKSIVQCEKHVALAKKAADESIVLLKNNGVLPFDKTKIKSIAIIGPNGDFGDHFENGKQAFQLFHADGSAHVDPGEGNTVTPYVGINNRVGNTIPVRFAAGAFAETGCGVIEMKYLTCLDGTPGLTAEYFNNLNLQGDSTTKKDQKIDAVWSTPPVWVQKDASATDGFSVRWSGSIEAPETREYLFALLIDGSARLYIDDELVLDWETHYRIDIEKYASVQLNKGSHAIRVEFRQTQKTAECRLLWDYGNVEYLAKAKELAKKSDAVVLAVGTTGNMEREGRDRSQLELFPPHEHLIKEIAKVNTNLVVVLYGNFFVMENWIDEVPAILEAGFPGQEGGHALADILFGTVNPSGKLSVTYPVNAGQYPEGFTQSGVSTEIEYREGIYVGYRYFEKEGKIPQFPFGHGLSYTTFEFSDLTVIETPAGFEVAVNVTNSGEREGAEVVQLYIHDAAASVDRPEKELKGFKRIHLLPGEHSRVRFTVSVRALAFYDETSDVFVAEAGEFRALIGSSSANIKLSQTFGLAEGRRFEK